VGLAPLLQMRNLTSLTVQCVSDADAQHVLSQMPGLQELVVGSRWDPCAPGCITTAALSRLSVCNSFLACMDEWMTYLPTTVSAKPLAVGGISTHTAMTQPPVASMVCWLPSGL
jgi:hypothetical protein